MDTPKFISEYEDVLHNIEFAIIEVHRNLPLVDYDVMEALEALITWFKHVGQVRGQKTPNLSQRAQLVFVAARDVCEWRMGQESSTTDRGVLNEGFHICSAEEIVACLKRVQKSVKKWNKQYGRQGYLNFVGKYLV
jgi:hypothetical protein